MNDRERFVDEHFHPQFKDLVNRYEPDLLWGDGEWEMTSDKWKTPELMTWLYTESPVKDKVVINDRWGQETRHHHGGYYTTEYESEADFDKPWEECRGMGFSFGYNRNEDIEDYNSAQTLVLMLCDLVSNGGNLLLDIGPDDRGRIPVIMQERLLQIGEWLHVNGEAIYGTRKWKDAVQWTEGKRDCKDVDEHYVGGDYILKQTINPIGPECAVKEIFFTYKNRDLYAITPLWKGDKLIVKNVKADANTVVSFLDSGEELKWSQNGANIEIELPDYNPNKIRTNLAYAFKITNIKEYAKSPKISVKYHGFSKNPLVELTAQNNAKIFYTTDGSIPTEKSKVYTAPLEIKKNTLLKCMASEEAKLNSDVVAENIEVYKQVKSIQFVHQPSNRYAANGAVSLMDQKLGTTIISEGNWLGFEGTNADLIIDFGKKQEINEVNIGFLQSQASWIFLPKNIHFLISKDGKNFEKMGSLEIDSAKEGENKREEIIKQFDSIKARYLKIEIENLGACPDWHKGAGGAPWIFMDEIEIK
jgi:hypothetical protein